jgi:alkanesulfonate monooxygenase SsuD/methylene tetrahydromethanopterin reductase-like flavin-dependent oxidoreductase (luciferase family)
VSYGRFLFGVGGGWNRHETEDHGMVFESRFKLMRERIEAMKEIWTKSKAEYHGDMVDFSEMMTWPKPVQKPTRRSWSAAAFRGPRAGQSAMATAGVRLAERAPACLCWRDTGRWRDAGRDPQTLPVTLLNLAEDEGELSRYRDTGVARVSTA